MTSNSNSEADALARLAADYLRASTVGGGTSGLPDRAAEAVGRGASSPALDYLAGLSRDSDVTAIATAMNQAAMELGLPVADSPTWRREFAELATALFLGGTLGAEEAADVVRAVLWGKEPDTEDRFDIFVSAALALEDYPEQRATLLSGMRASAGEILELRPELVARFGGGE